MEKLAKDTNILIIGSGGREHAIGLRLKHDGATNLFFAPGNAGTAIIGTNFDGLDLRNFYAIDTIVKDHKIDLVIIGPEAPLAEGLVNYLQSEDVKIIGPTKEAALLESSKIFARDLMAENNIPQPRYTVCPDEESAMNTLKDLVWIKKSSVVIKVDGLAAGKGVFVCHDHQDIFYAFKAIYKDKKFGETEIIIEECLVGTEMSVFALCDESGYEIIGTAQDYKRLLNGNNGPNTGGMGSIAPSPLETPELIAKIESRIIEPTLRAMQKLGTPFTGFLYCGLMIVKGEPYVIEFNARLGDPETQVILPLIRESFFDLLWLAANNKVASAKVTQHDLSTALIVKVAEGYPDNYHKGEIIDGFLSSNRVIHAGTKVNDKGKIVTNGGRVLGILGISHDLASAVRNAYSMMEVVKFPGEFYRRDIGKEYIQH